MHQTNDVHVLNTERLMTPDELRAELPMSQTAARHVFRAREVLRDILHGRDGRLLVIAGPCSIHDPEAALDYAEQLAVLCSRYRERLLIAMRVYFEKPRTSVGWKGLINDPHLDGTYDIHTGLRLARRLLLALAELGVPAATEMLDPIVPQYTAELVCWAAIGARTTESQTHREMASGLSMPVGFKNGTDGGLEVAVNAMIAAARPHSFLGIDGQGQVSVIKTGGNPDGHLVLRGGQSGPNYQEAQVRAASRELEAAGLNPRAFIDCSHDNCGKDHFRQVEVVREVVRQIRAGSTEVLGAMLESNLLAGRQALRPKNELVYGRSITDPCMDFATTEVLVDELAEATRSRGCAA
ncbi:MAG: 3-deoxy-7-phosphoheptulonate synthase [Polyangiaceae bacterium]|nr:3-deoxy-7-phosphoheptulonate synthase [Polyangiaceae bacterium]